MTRVKKDSHILFLTWVCIGWVFQTRKLRGYFVWAVGTFGIHKDSENRDQKY